MSKHHCTECGMFSAAVQVIFSLLSLESTNLERFLSPLHEKIALRSTHANP